MSDKQPLHDAGIPLDVDALNCCMHGILFKQCWAREELQFLLDRDVKDFPICANCQHEMRLRIERFNTPRANSY